MIKSFEDGDPNDPNFLVAVADCASGGAPWTAGFGCTTHTNGVPFQPGEKFTAEELDEIFLWEVSQKAAGVSRLVTVPLSANEFSALVSLAYNIGVGNVGSSTLLRLLNSGAPLATVADQFLLWNRASGRVMDGLTRRRAAEKALFLTPDVPSAAPAAKSLFQRLFGR